MKIVQIDITTTKAYTPDGEVAGKLRLTLTNADKTPALDVNKAVTLLEPAACLAIASRLQRFALEELAPQTGDVAAVEIIVTGAAEPARLAVMPDSTVMSCSAAYGQAMDTFVTLINHSSQAVIPFKLDADSVITRESVATSDPFGAPDAIPSQAKLANIAFEASSGVIQPGEAVQVKVTVVPLALGCINISIPVIAPTALSAGECQSSQPTRPTAAASIELRTVCIGPEVVPSSTEIDFGLIAVGGATSAAVTFRNTGSVAVLVDLSTKGEDTASTASAAAAAAAAYGNRRPSSASSAHTARSRCVPCAR